MRGTRGSTQPGHLETSPASGASSHRSPGLCCLPGTGRLLEALQLPRPWHLPNPSRRPRVPPPPLRCLPLQPPGCHRGGDPAPPEACAPAGTRREVGERWPGVRQGRSAGRSPEDTARGGQCPGCPQPRPPARRASPGHASESRALGRAGRRAPPPPASAGWTHRPGPGTLPRRAPYPGRAAAGLGRGAGAPGAARREARGPGARRGARRQTPK